MTDALNWILNGTFLATLLYYWAYRKAKPPATATASNQANTVNQQGNHNRNIRKKKVSNEALAWIKCNDLQRTIDNLEAQLMDKTLMNQELLGIIKDRDSHIDDKQRIIDSLQVTIDRYDREFIRMSEKIERLEGLPLLEMKLAT